MRKKAKTSNKMTHMEGKNHSKGPEMAQQRYRSLRYLEKGEIS
jgi:hypothetical protein